MGEQPADYLSNQEYGRQGEGKSQPSRMVIGRGYREAVRMGVIVVAVIAVDAVVAVIAGGSMRVRPMRVRPMHVRAGPVCVCHAYWLTIV